MRYRSALGWVGVSGWALALIACGAAGTSPQDPASPDPGAAGPPPVVIAPPPASPPDSSAAPAASAAPGSSPAQGTRACKLAAAKKSADACQTDADCGPSLACHAPACVAKAKSATRPLSMMCTQTVDCDTADANRCGCYEGSCALIPPT